MKTRNVICIADLHIGSRIAPWPEVYEREEKGIEIRATKVQTQLREYWDDFWGQEQAKKADTVILLGDLCQGNNRREFGRGLSAIELEIHVDVAHEMLSEKIENRKVIGISGTDYHQSLEMKLDHLVIDKLGGKFCGLISPLRIVGTGKRALITHEIAGGFIYQAGALDKFGQFLDMAQAKKEIPHHIDLVLGGHRHFFLHLEDKNRHLIQVPGWQLFIQWSKVAKYYGKYQPNLGGVVVEIGDDIRVHKFLYPLIKVHDRMVSI